MSRRKALTQTAIDDYTIAWRAHNKECRRNYQHYFEFESLEQYIKYVRGEKFIPQKNPIPQFKTKVCDKNEVYPSHTASVGNCLKSEPHVYSGERKLVGIATMHKSNMVPIFADEEGGGAKEATEIADMSK